LEAQVNGTQLKTCLGDLFAVMWMKFIDDGDGSATMQDFFTTVRRGVASYAALHYGQEENQQYGDLSIAKLKTADFFYPAVSIASPRIRPVFKFPKSAFSAPRLEMDRFALIYSDAAAMPMYRGKKQAAEMRKASKRLRVLTAQQELTQDTYWALIEYALPDADELQEHVWQQRARAKNPACEIAGHDALVQACKGSTDVSSSFALQFHQVLVNLCAREELGWAADPLKAVDAALAVCKSAASAATILV